MSAIVCNTRLIRKKCQQSFRLCHLFNGSGPFFHSFIALCRTWHSTAAPQSWPSASDGASAANELPSAAASFTCGGAIGNDVDQDVAIPGCIHTSE